MAQERSKPGNSPNNQAAQGRERPSALSYDNSTVRKLSKHGFTFIWRLLIGRPLRASESTKENIGPIEGLSALSLDALTSVAYGPQAMMTVLATAGAGAIGMIEPITVVIVLLLALLVISYRQIIEQFPQGGGAYTVAKDSLGRNASLVAGASLVIDYTLTVAVSIAAGVQSLISAFPSLAGSKVTLCLAMLVIITFMNLRGLGEAARAFLLPTAAFIAGIIFVIVIGLLHPLGPQTASTYKATMFPASNALGAVLILKAFSAGCSALTGVEAIANGVPLFKHPKVAKARRTELLLGVLLGIMLLGLATLTNRFHILPHSNATVLSQIISVSLGHNWGYYALSVTITLALGLAANTSFGGLPVLAGLLAKDNFLPHRFALRGERQVYNAGIWVLAALAAILLIGVAGDTASLIPMFAIGVFTGFTIAQTGLLVQLRRTRPQGWRLRAMLSGLGALATALSTGVFLFSKFTSGAWLIVIAIPAFILIFLRVGSYYHRAAQTLGLGDTPPQPSRKRVRVIVPVSQVSMMTGYALSEALSLSDDVVAIYVSSKLPASDDNRDASADPNSIDQGPPGDSSPEYHSQGSTTSEKDSFTRQWERWDPKVKLVVVESEYASVVESIVDFIDSQSTTDDIAIMVLIPVVVPDKKRFRLLHNQMDIVLSTALHERTDIIVARSKFALPATIKRRS